MSVLRGYLFCAETVTQIRVWLVSTLAHRHIKTRLGSFALQHRRLAIYHFREYGSLVARMIGLVPPELAARR